MQGHSSGSVADDGDHDVNTTGDAADPADQHAERPVIDARPFGKG